MGSRCIADELRWDQGECACVKCNTTKKEQSTMGSRRVKKVVPKQKFVDLQSYDLFADALVFHAEASTEKILELEKRLSKVEDIANNHTVKIDTGKASAEMLNRLKQEMVKQHLVWDFAYGYPSQEKCKAHDIVGHKINGMLCGYYVPTPTPQPEPALKVSNWRNVGERTQHTLKAVQDALRLMQGIEYIIGQTFFTVKVRCNGLWRPITMHFNGTRQCWMEFTYRNGIHERRDFANTTQAAAGIVAVCMYYATR